MTIAMKDLRSAIEALPVHEIEGYEWECYTCHFHSHWLGDDGPLPCGHPLAARADHGTDEYDADGVMCDHRSLLDRDRVLAVLAELER